MKYKIYLAGPLFNAGERLHNLFLERYLKDLGFEIILPQKEALRFFDGEKFDVAAIVADCAAACRDHKTIVVACLDGTDADSGTAVELAIAREANGRVIVYRTDFRTDICREIGMNAMLLGEGSRLIYEPCFFTEYEQVNKFYKKLAARIYEEVMKIEESGALIE